MVGTALVTLGRLPKALDICRGLHAAGFRVVVADPHAWHLCRMSRSVARSVTVTAPAVDPAAYRDELLALVEREGVELIVPVSEEILHVAHLHGRLPGGVRLHAMAPEVLLALHSKAGFVRKAAEYGVAAPATALLGSPRALELAASGAVVIKPVYSCAGRGVRFPAVGTPLPAVDPEVPAVVQQRIDGEVYTSFSMAHRGRGLVTVIYRAAVLSGTVAVVFERVVRHPAIEAWVTRFIAAAAFDGFISFDFVVDRNGEAVGIECNPRATSGIHFVEPADLGRALVMPAAAGAVRLREARFMQQFWPTLSEFQHARGERRRKVLQQLRTAVDVTWRADDPLPLLTMPATAWPIIRAAAREGRPFGEVATRDVGWYADGR